MKVYTEQLCIQKITFENACWEQQSQLIAFSALDRVLFLNLDCGPQVPNPQATPRTGPWPVRNSAVRHRLSSAALDPSPGKIVLPET